MSNKFLFIVGVGRSGTSLLQCMLNSHKEIAFLPETHFVRRYLHLEKDLNAILPEITRDDDLRKIGVDLDMLGAESSTTKDLYERILLNYGEQKKKHLIGDKDPKNIEYLKTISRNFDKSFVIHIYRDPRAVIASRKKAKWSHGRPLWMDLLAYKTQINYGRKLGRTIVQNYYEIKYEDMVQEPKDILAKLLSALKLEYDPNIENYYKSSSELIIGEEISWKKKCFEPVSCDGLQKWRSELTKKEIAKIEHTLATEMSELNYTPIIEHTSLQYFSLWFYRGFIKLAAFVYRFSFK